MPDPFCLFTSSVQQALQMGLTGGEAEGCYRPQTFGKFAVGGRTVNCAHALVSVAARGCTDQPRSPEM